MNEDIASIRSITNLTHLSRQIGSYHRNSFESVRSRLSFEWNPSRVSMTVPPPPPSVAIFRISVQDTGPGISKENQKKLFKEIVQFSPEKLQNGGGSGVGLHTSKKIMDLHGGGLTVFSAGEGHGTTFVMTLPMTKTGYTTSVADGEVEGKTEEVKDTERNKSNETSFYGRCLPKCFLPMQVMRSVSIGQVQAADTIISPLPLVSAEGLRENSNDLADNNVEDMADIRLSSEASSEHFIMQEESSSPRELFSFSSSPSMIQRNNESLVKCLEPGSDNKHRPRVADIGHISTENTRGRKIIPKTTFKQETTVLIVDDSAMTRRLMGMKMKELFDNVLEADDGFRAVCIVHSYLTKGLTIDLVLMDSSMDIIHGPIAAHEMRALGFHGLIFGVTGNGVQTDIDNFIEKGANAVLVKPLDMSLLMIRLREYGTFVESRWIPPPRYRVV